MMFYHTDAQSPSPTSQMASQGKDIGMKCLTAYFKRDMWELIMGKNNVPPVMEAMPTEFPAVMTNDRLADGVYKLSSASFMIVDFESEFKKEKFISYQDYAGRVLTFATSKEKPAWVEKHLSDMKIRFVVIYLAGVSKNQVMNSMDWQSLKIETEVYFLEDLDGPRRITPVFTKMEKGESLTDEDTMLLSIYPGTIKGRVSIHKAVQNLLTHEQDYINLCMGQKDREEDIEKIHFALGYLSTF